MKIGMLSDYVGLTTSYGTVTKHMLNALKERGHDVYNFALQYPGNPIDDSGIHIYPAGGEDEAKRSFMKAKVDVIIHLRDNWVYTPFSREHYSMVDHVHASGSAYVNYTPIQSTPVPEEFDESLYTEADMTFTMSKWGVDYFKSRGIDNVEWMPHGVQPGLEYMDIDRKKRPFNFPDGNMLMNIGLAMDYRKLTPIHLLVLKKYLTFDKDAFLYLHTQPRSYFMNDVIAKGLGITEKNLLVSPYADPRNATHGVSINELNQLYNMTDAYMNLSTSEGFGLTELEAASLGVPTLVTDNPVHREVLSGYPSVHFIPARKHFPTPWGFEWMVDEADAVNTLYTLNQFEFPREKPMIKAEHTYEFVAERTEKLVEKLI